MVTSTNELSYAAGRHLRVLLSQIHGNLAHQHIVTFARTAKHMLLTDTVMVTYLIQNLINGQRFVINLHGALNNTLSQSHVDIGVVNHAICQQRVDNTLQVAHAAIGCLGDKLDDIPRNIQAVTTAFCSQDILAKLYVRLFQLSYQSTGETGQQTVLDTLQVNRRTVGSQNNLLAQAEQVVEDMEERVQRSLRRSPFLNIIDYQHVDRLIELNEVVNGILAHGIRELDLEQAG